MKPSILITGTSSGIGLAAVKRFTGDGFQVAATVRREEHERMLAERFPGIDVLNVELSDEAAITGTVGGYLADRGGVDVVVNNAGFGCVGPVEELSMHAWRAQMETNFFAAVNITRLALPHMRRKGGGRIIQVSSGAGVSVIPIFAPYCTSKHALEAFSEALRHEVAAFGIRVSIIGPGPVSTRFQDNRRILPAKAVARSPYRRIYEAMLKRTLKAHENASSAEEVADKIHEAATAKHPRPRYAVGPLGYAAEISRFVPRRILAWSLRSMAS